MSTEIDDKEDAAPKVPAEFEHLLAGMPAGLEIADIDFFEAGEKGDSFFHRFSADHPEPSSKGLSEWKLIRSAGLSEGKVVVISLRRVRLNAAARLDIKNELRAGHRERSPFTNTGSFKSPKTRVVGPSISSCGFYENVQIEAGIGAEAVSVEPETDDISLDDDEVRTEIISHIMKGANEDVLASRMMIAELKAGWPFELEAKN